MKFMGGDMAGVYATVIFHLVVLAGALSVQIGYSLSGENSFLLDFSAHEEKERVEKENDFHEDIADKIDRMLAESESGGLDYRNIAVNRATLKDDRGTDAEQLYKDAERLRQDLSDGVPQHDMSEEFADPVTKQQRQEDNKASESQYSGVTVLSYELGGRKGSYLPTPAYKCMGAGMVTVIITVNNSGKVLDAKVQDELSSADDCMRRAAINAARRSRFSSDPSAPSRHVGNIVYQFIAQ